MVGEGKQDIEFRVDRLVRKNRIGELRMRVLPVDGLVRRKTRWEDPFHMNSVCADGREVEVVVDIDRVGVTVGVSY